MSKAGSMIIDFGSKMKIFLQIINPLFCCSSTPPLDSTLMGITMNKYHDRIRLLLALISIAVLLPFSHSCSLEFSWTSEDKKNAEHFFRSLEADAAAIRIINKGLSPTIVSQEDIQKIIEYRKLALSEAKLVIDSVLDKAHPQLREHFRYEYEKGLDLYLKSLEKPDFASQITGSTLLDQWGDWLNSHNDEIKIPKRR